MPAGKNSRLWPRSSPPPPQYWSHIFSFRKVLVPRTCFFKYGMKRVYISGYIYILFIIYTIHTNYTCICGCACDVSTLSSEFKEASRQQRPNQEKEKEKEKRKEHGTKKEEKTISRENAMGPNGKRELIHYVLHVVMLMYIRSYRRSLNPFTLASFSPSTSTLHTYIITSGHVE